MGGWGAGSLFQSIYRIQYLFLKFFFNFCNKLPKLPRLPIFTFSYIFNPDLFLIYTLLYRLVLNTYGELYWELWKRMGSLSKNIWGSLLRSNSVRMNILILSYKIMEETQEQVVKIKRSTNN